MHVNLFYDSRLYHTVKPFFLFVCFVFVFCFVLFLFLFFVLFLFLFCFVCLFVYLFVCLFFIRYTKTCTDNARVRVYWNQIKQQNKTKNKNKNRTKQTSNKKLRSCPLVNTRDRNVSEFACLTLLFLIKTSSASIFLSYVVSRDL